MNRIKSLFCNETSYQIPNEQVSRTVQAMQKIYSHFLHFVAIKNLRRFICFLNRKETIDTI